MGARVGLPLLLAAFGGLVATWFWVWETAQVRWCRVVAEKSCLDRRASGSRLPHAVASVRRWLYNESIHQYPGTRPETERI